MANIVFIDNQDSFTYNLVDELEKLNHKVTVYRNTVSKQTIESKVFELQKAGQSVILFFSPGPGTPSDSPCMSDLLKSLSGVVPIFGVCLGHQAIAEYFGGKVGLAGETVHGKSSVIQCEAHPIFDGLPRNLTVARYHSLVATSVPDNLMVIGHYNNMPMAFIDENNRILSFQFHPESILTTLGAKLLEQSINYLLKESGQ